ncbi:hypothetical protein ScPMuIL_015636 [Solemya velum]
MDPNSWGNYSQPYSHLASGNSMAPPHGAVNRYDLPLLAAEQAGLSSGLGLGSSVQPHTGLSSSRSLAGMSPYGHLNTMSQFLDTIGSLQTPFGTMSQHQHAYKTVHVGQHAFGFQPPGRTTTDQHSVYQDATGITTQQKSAYYSQEKNVPKELSLTFSPSSLPSQTSPLDTSPKPWGLTNFVQMQSSPFSGSLPPESSSELSSHSQQVLPPPAHSSASHHHSIQRNPYDPLDSFLQVKHEKSHPIQHSVPSLHSLGSRPDAHTPSHSLSSVHTSHQIYAQSSQLIEDLSLPHPKYGADVRHDLPGLISTVYSGVTSEPSRYTSSQISADMDYDPVSPATPINESHQQAESFSTMSLQDLASLDSPEKTPISQFDVLQNDSSLLLMSESRGKVNRLSGQQEARNSRYSVEVISQATHSPLGQSPISVGGSPQASVSIASPSAALVNPSVVHLAAHGHKTLHVSVSEHHSPVSSSSVNHQPAVQAVADSTTKPPKRRGRKKKEVVNPPIREHVDTGKVYVDIITSRSHNSSYTRHSPQSVGDNMISAIPRRDSYLVSQSHNSDNLISEIPQGHGSYLGSRSHPSPENLISKLPRQVSYLGNKSHISPDNLISDLSRQSSYLSGKSRTPPSGLEHQSSTNPTYERQSSNNSTYEHQSSNNPMYEHQSSTNPTFEHQSSTNPTYEHQSSDNPKYELQKSNNPTFEHQRSTYLQHQRVHHDHLQKSQAYPNVSKQRVASPTEVAAYSSMAAHKNSQHGLPSMSGSVGDESPIDACAQFNIDTLQDRDSLSGSVIRKTPSVVTERIEKTQLPMPNELENAINEPDFVDELRALNQNSLESFEIDKHQSSVMDDLESVLSEESAVLHNKYSEEMCSKSVDSFQDTPDESSKQSLENDLLREGSEVSNDRNGSMELKSQTSLVDTLQSTRQELESPSLQSTIQSSLDSILPMESQTEYSEVAVGSLSGADQYNLTTNENRAFYSPLSEEPNIGSITMPQHCEMGHEYPNNYQNVLNATTSGFVHNLGELSTNSTSTIDESMLSSLMTDQFSYRQGHESYRYRTKAEQKIMPLMVTAVTSDVYCDEDLSHLSRPPPQKKYSDKTKNIEVERTCRSVTKSSDFQNSFLSFLSGKRQETLSSLTNSVIGKKPQLPKYIPEVPRIVSENSNSACSTSTPDADSKFGDNIMNSKPSSPTDSQGRNGAFSNDEGGTQEPNESVSEIISKLETDISKCAEKPSLKICISKHVLTAKARKNKSKSPKTVSPPKCRRTSYRESDDAQSSEEEYFVKQTTVKPKHIHRRQTSVRKAKEKNRQKKKSKKYFMSDESSDDADWMPSEKSGVSGGESVDYDSDEDPAWTPFSGETRKMATYDGGSNSRRRPKGKSKKKGSVVKPAGGLVQDVTSLAVETPAKIPKESPVVVSPAAETRDTAQSSPPTKPGTPTTSQESSTNYQIGSFILDKRDLNNFESYPIWKIETNRMLQKFELFLDNGRIRHRALSTFSSWLPSLQNQFVPIRVDMVNWSREKAVVEVVDECRPKPTLDSSIAENYEEDPLSELFNIYLQIFLSQALEPGFLNAMRESSDNFYLNPLHKIDTLIDKKLKELEAVVCWKHEFKQYLKERPHLRELDRPNVKQACQASQFASHPAVKSIHLYGRPYDRFDLEEIAGCGSIAKEFFIGKVAAQYVKPFHSLYHFKYNLYKRCLAKVNIIKDTEGDIDNAEILDLCLHNRTWVLKIFEDLKNMLEKG